MDDKRDIGEAFKEKLEKLQESPQDEVWEKIAAKLENKKKRVIPFWIKIAGVAVFILSIGGVYLLKNRKAKTKIEIVNKSKSIIKENKSDISNKNNADSTRENKNDLTIPTEKNTIKKSNEKGELATKNKLPITNKNNTSISKNRWIGNTKNKQSSRNHSYAKRQKNTIKNTTNKTNVDGFLQENLNENKKQELRKNATAIYLPKRNEKYNYLRFYFAELPKVSSNKNALKKKRTEKDKWKVSVKGTPIFLKSLLNDYLIDASLDDYVTNDVSSSYGLQISRSLSRKIRLRTGIHQLKFSSNVRNIDIDALQYTSNVSYVSGVIDGGVIYASYEDEESIYVTQKTSYFEIPLELSINLLDRRIGVNAIAGMSALVLKTNEVLINNETKIGTVNNLNKLSYTGNVGLGFYYKINKHINITVEPLFKFKFRGYKNVNNVSYYFGAYSGFSYKF